MGHLNDVQLKAKLISAVSEVKELRVVKAEDEMAVVKNQSPLHIRTVRHSPQV